MPIVLTFRYYLTEFLSLTLPQDMIVENIESVTNWVLMKLRERCPVDIKFCYYFEKDALWHQANFKNITEVLEDGVSYARDRIDLKVSKEPYHINWQKHVYSSSEALIARNFDFSGFLESLISKQESIKVQARDTIARQHELINECDETDMFHKNLEGPNPDFAKKANKLVDELFDFDNEPTSSTTVKPAEKPKSLARGRSSIVEYLLAREQKQAELDKQAELKKKVELQKQAQLNQQAELKKQFESAPKTKPFEKKQDDVHIYDDVVESVMRYEQELLLRRQQNIIKMHKAPLELTEATCAAVVGREEDKWRVDEEEALTTALIKQVLELKSEKSRKMLRGALRELRVKSKAERNRDKQEKRDKKKRNNYQDWLKSANKRYYIILDKYNAEKKVEGKTDKAVEVEKKEELLKMLEKKKEEEDEETESEEDVEKEEEERAYDLLAVKKYDEYDWQKVKQIEKEYKEWFEKRAEQMDRRREDEGWTVEEEVEEIEKEMDTLEYMFGGRSAISKTYSGQANGAIYYLRWLELQKRLEAIGQSKKMQYYDGSFFDIAFKKTNTGQFDHKIKIRRKEFNQWAVDDRLKFYENPDLAKCIENIDDFDQSHIDLQIIKERKEIKFGPDNRGDVYVWEKFWVFRNLSDETLENIQLTSDVFNPKKPKIRANPFDIRKNEIAVFRKMRIYWNTGGDDAFTEHTEWEHQKFGATSSQPNTLFSNITYDLKFGNDKDGKCCYEESGTESDDFQRPPIKYLIHEPREAESDFTPVHFEFFKNQAAVLEKMSEKCRCSNNSYMDHLDEQEKRKAAELKEKEEEEKKEKEEEERKKKEKEEKNRRLREEYEDVQYARYQRNRNLTDCHCDQCGYLRFYDMESVHKEEKAEEVVTESTHTAIAPEEQEKNVEIEPSEAMTESTMTAIAPEEDEAEEKSNPMTESTMTAIAPEETDETLNTTMTESTMTAIAPEEDSESSCGDEFEVIDDPEIHSDSSEGWEDGSVELISSRQIEDN